MAKKPPKPRMGEVAASLSEMSLLGFTERSDQNEEKRLTSYPGLLRDDQVYACFQQRRLAVVSADWSVEPGGESPQDKKAALALEENLKQLTFDDICDQMLFGVFYGRSIAEVIWEPAGEMVRIAAIRPKDPLKFNFDRSGRLLFKQTSAKGLEMPPRKFWSLYPPQSVANLGGGRGLAHYLYWPVYIKRHVVRFWAVFAEKFSTPSVKGVFPPGATEVEKQALLQACGALGSEAAVVIPEGMQVELVEAARRGGGDYNQFIEALNRAISKVILSQTMTTDDGSSRAQATVHETVRDKLVKSDAALLCESFNHSVVKWWSEWNFPDAKPPKVMRQVARGEDLNARANLDAILMDRGIRPSEDYIKRTYGEGWTIKPVPQGGAAMSAPKFASGDQEEEPPSEWLKLATETTDRLQKLADESPSIKEFARRLPEIAAEDSNNPGTNLTNLSVLLAKNRVRENEDGD